MFICTYLFSFNVLALLPLLFAVIFNKFVFRFDFFNEPMLFTLTGLLLMMQLGVQIKTAFNVHAFTHN